MQDKIGSCCSCKAGVLRRGQKEQQQQKMQRSRNKNKQSYRHTLVAAAEPVDTEVVARSVAGVDKTPPNIADIAAPATSAFVIPQR